MTTDGRLRCAAAASGAPVDIFVRMLLDCGDRTCRAMSAGLNRKAQWGGRQAKTTPTFRVWLHQRLHGDADADDRQGCREHGAEHGVGNTRGQP